MGMDYFIPQDEAHLKYDKLVTVTTEAIDGPKYHKDAAKCEALVHKVNGASDSKRKCMIYFHGGGCVAGTP